jgi:hypothetical protein
LHNRFCRDRLGKNKRPEIRTKNNNNKKKKGGKSGLVLGRPKTWSYFASQEPRKESQGKGTEGVITSATIGGQSSEGGNFVVVIVVVCQEIFTFLCACAFCLSCGSCGFGFRQESIALWSLRICVKILRVLVGRKKMTVL